MEFKHTGLPDKKIFKDAFRLGWEQFQEKQKPLCHDAKGRNALQHQYMQGPVAVAKMIVLHGGEFRQFVAAACLAGPAVFSDKPCGWMNDRIRDLATELLDIEEHDFNEVLARVPELSVDARLVLQASIIRYLEVLSHETLGCGVCPGGQYDEICEEAFFGALNMYHAARGAQDVFGLDTRFEIAIHKANMALQRGCYAH